MKSQSVLGLHVAELRLLFNAMDPAPLEIFLHDRWPIRSQALLQDRVGVMDVRPVVAGIRARPA
jgi:hypothetical protein